MTERYEFLYGSKPHHFQDYVLFAPLPLDIFSLVVANFDEIYTYVLLVTQSARIVYATKENLWVPKSSDFWFADGTFDMVLLIFKQLYTIH